MPIEPPDNRELGDEGAPGDLIQSVVTLAGGLDDAIPAKRLDRNLIVGSWNVRELGRLTPKWVAAADVVDEPSRNFGDLWCIAEIASRFDVLAIQEVQNETAALEWLMRILGRDWGLLVTDVSTGAKSGYERLAFAFDLRRVRPTGLAGEIVLSAEDLKVEVGGLDRQLVHPPYVVSFSSARRPFALATVHIIWGKNVAGRAAESRALAQLLRRVVKDPSPETPDDFRANLLAIGDFNIAKVGDPIYTALVEEGLQPDPALAGLPRTTGDTAEKSTAYDQIAWFAPGQEGGLTMPRLSSGTFAWPEHVTPIGAGDPTFRISDHYPVWVELDVARRG